MARLTKENSPLADPTSLRISGMSCASCASRLERVLNRLDGVQARVDYATERAIVSWPKTFDREEVFAAIRKAGFDAEIEGARAIAIDASTGRTKQDYLFPLTIICVMPFFASMVAMAFGRHDVLPGWSAVVIASFVQFFIARHFYWRAWSALRSGDANMDVLVVMSTTVTYVFSLWNYFFNSSRGLFFETSVFILFFVSLGKWIEARAKARAADEIETLLTDRPPTVYVEVDGALREQRVSELKLGDVFVLRPGDNIAVDGEIIDGESEVNEALLTGEAHPVYRRLGDKVYAGTINLNGKLHVRATKLGAETVVAQLGEIVKNAQFSRSSMTRLVDRVTRVFVPVILVIAITVFAIWFAETGELAKSMLPAIAVMVIACPCALGLATPTVLMVAGGRAARMGILFRNVAALEGAAKTDTMVFDKTGTLTRGQFNVSDVMPAEDVSTHRLLTDLLALESHAEHPLARAIANYARSHNADRREISSFLSLPGRGVTGLSDGTKYQACAPAYLMQQGYTLPYDMVEKLEGEGKTVVAVAAGAQYTGLIALEDVTRAEAFQTVLALEAARIELHLLTGDNAQSAQRLAKSLRISHYRAGILPEGKADYIIALIREGRNVAMVGDGVNDAPALASANVSIAMGCAAGISINQADIVLLRNNLGAITDMLKLARATRSKIRSNLAFAFLYNICAVPLAAAGYLTPAIAAAAMALSSISVILNALLLKRNVA